MDSENYLAHAFLNHAQAKNNQYNSALVSIERALQLEPQGGFLHRAHAETLGKLERWADAIMAYRRHLVAERGDAGGWCQMWFAAVKASDLDAMQEAAFGWTNAAPEQEHAWHARAHTHVAWKDYNTAIYAAERALALKPIDAIARLVRIDLGLALLRTGNLERLRSLLAEWPDTASDLPAGAPKTIED